MIKYGHGTMGVVENAKLERGCFVKNTTDK